MGESLDVVLGQFEAVNRRDFAVAMSLYADDVVLVSHGFHTSAPEVVEGKKAVGEWFGDWFRQFRSWSNFEFVEHRERGGRVFLSAHHRAAGRVSGAEVETLFTYVYIVRDGLICRAEMFNDREAALAAFETAQ
jgi:ketosteroid isomerase-like protein